MNDKNARRKFVQSLSLGFGLTALGFPFSSLAHNLMNSTATTYTTKKLGVALVGLGSYSTNQLAPALQQTNNCYLAGIVTGSPEKAKTWAERYNIPAKNIYNYENFDTIANNPDIDIVYVVLPNSMHADFTIRAAKAGKHVICEKPMATSVKEAEAMIAACKKANKLLSIGYRLHFDPYHQEVMRLGREKILGPIKLIEASFGFRAGDPNQWRLNKQLAGGGPLMDVGIYAIQGARYVTGEEPVAVRAQAFNTDPAKFKTVEESIFWQLEFPSGAVANSSSSYATRMERLYGAATNGWFELSPAYMYNGLKGRTNKGPLEYAPLNQQAAQMDDFADCVLNNKPSRVAGEEGLKDMKILEAIYKAAATGKRIEIA